MKRFFGNPENALLLMNHDDVVKKLEEEVFCANIGKFHESINNDFSGIHLKAAVAAYTDTYEDTHKVTDAKIAMILYLRKYIKDEVVADNIATWLKINYISLEPQTKFTKSQYIPFNYIENSNEALLFTDQELYLLERIQYLQLKDLSHASYGIDRLSFSKMLHRETATKEIIEIGERQYKASQQTEINKQDLTFMIVKGGSGFGKTRILSEIVNILRKVKPETIFKNTSIIYFNFTNGFLLEATNERDQKHISMISSRIIYAAFNEGCFINRIPQIENQYFLYEILKIISLKLHDQFKIEQNVPIPLIIAFDEYQQATRLFKDLHTIIPHKIGLYMRNFQKSHGLILYPVFGGTLLESNVKFEPTDYLFTTLSLPSLRPEDINTIINEEKVSEFYTSRYKGFWNLVGVVPRHLEWAIEFAKELQNNTTVSLDTKISDIYLKIVKKVYALFQTSELRNTYLYLTTLTLSGYKYNHETDKYSSKVEELVTQGRIYKINDHIGLPPAFIDKFSETNIEIPKKLLNDFVYSSNKQEWEIFEELCLKTITCKLNYIFKLAPKYAKHDNNTIFLSPTIGDVFYGAHIPNSIASIELSSSITTSNYFSFNTTNKPITEVIKKPLSNSSVTKTKKNQKGIDGFLPELSSLDRKILFVVQNKFLNIDSQDKTIQPQELKEFYEGALMDVKDYDVYLIIITNKRASQTTINSIKENGEIPTKPNPLECSRLILISGDCFQNFFHPFIANILV
ncbi:hypothetical protein ABK040_004030 [Willaertia magna]